MVEDNVAYRELVQILVEMVPNVLWLGGSSNLAEARTFLETNRPEIVFLDINLPDGAGWDLFPLAGPLNRGPKIVVVSGVHNDSIVVRASRPPFFGHIDKASANIHEWQKATTRLLSGKRYWSPWFEGQLKWIHNDTDHWSKQLSAQEISLMAWFGRGLDNLLISERVGLSPNTIQSHRKAIMKKLDLRSSPLLVRWIRDHFYPL